MAITTVLATLHIVMLVLVVLSLVYALGDLGDALDNLNTFVGLGLFAYLWVLTWFATSEALERLGWPELVYRYDLAPQSMVWGGVTGIATIVVALPFVMAVFLVDSAATGTSDEGVSGAFLLPFAALIASPFAFATGAFVGLLAGLTDMVLLMAANVVIRSSRTSADAEAADAAPE